MDAVTVVERYYDALDTHEYAAFDDLLDPAFVQQRPDRRFEGREAFVRFMRDERPNANTTHELDQIVDGGDDVAVRGRVLGDGSEAILFEFADFFDVEDGKIVRLETYSRYQVSES
jgi:ketosteroid isomerase-like protein